jgi:membrane protease YdiL (CAAX protease family)
MINSTNQILGGFADPPPESLASSRHLRRLLYIVLGIAVAMLVQARKSAPIQAAPSRLPLYLALIAVELVLVWFVAIGIRARGHTLRELLGRRWRTAFDGAGDLILALATAGFLRVSGPLLYSLLGPWASNTSFLLPETLPESIAWIAVSAAAGTCEELVFRGYLQRQLWSLTKNLPAALLLQAFIFSIGHIYQGWKPALVTAIYGLVFGLVAAWRRSIIPGAIAHAIVDVMGGLMRGG